jgi:hypothetical protein
MKGISMFMIFFLGITISTLLAAFMIFNLVFTAFRTHTINLTYEPYVIPAFVMFMGAVVFSKGVVWFRRGRIIGDVQTSKIRSLAMGLVEIEGEVVSNEEVLKSPASGKDCVYYRYRMERRTKGGKAEWTKVKEMVKKTTFYLDDGTGKVLVDPAGAKIDTMPESMMFEDSDFDALEGMRRIFDDSLVSMDKNTRFSETLISPGDKLYIIGTAGDNPYKEEGSAGQSADDIMIQTGKADKTYYISSCPQGRAVNYMRQRSFITLFAGASMMIICAAIMLLYSGLL